jgi:hypothetical protein
MQRVAELIVFPNKLYARTYMEKSAFAFNPRLEAFGYANSDDYSFVGTLHKSSLFCARN